jgi:membrane carboxypeptidase/penicillin-binding protein PbpC
LAEVTLCAESGMTAGAACPARIREFLPRPHTLDHCSWHHASDRGSVTVYPEIYRSWAQAQAGTSAPLIAGASAPTSRSATTLAIISPPSGATYLIDPTLRADYQSLSLKAEGAVGRIEWSLNGQSLAATLGDTPLTWPLVRGTHTISARDANGRHAQSQIVVK